MPNEPAEMVDGPSTHEADVAMFSDAFPGSTVLGTYPRRRCERCGDRFTAFVDRWRECADCRMHPKPLWRLREELKARGEL